MKMRCLAFTVATILAGCASAPTARAPRDPFGDWHITRIYSGTKGHEPARDFVVGFRRTANPPIVRIDLAGMDSYAGASTFVEGEQLTTTGFGPITGGNCVRREDIETSNDEIRKQRPSSTNPCWAIQADEDLIADILGTASSWREQGGILIVRSNPKDSWIELRR
jgi:hypothetical protein